MAARLVLLRHASAGSRETWAGDDRLRPLDELGRADADRLVRDLEGQLRSPTALVSSPLRRCLQTLEPLAAALGVEVRPDGRLAEDETPLASDDAWPDAAWLGARALAAIDDHAADVADGCLVVCSHGEVLPALLGSLIGRTSGAVRGVDGLDLTAKALPKAAAWVLDRSGADLVVRRVGPPVR